MTPSFGKGVNTMQTQTQSLIRHTRYLLSAGLLLAGIVSFGSLTLIQTNAAQASPGPDNCSNVGRPFKAKGCLWQKKLCFPAGSKWGTIVTKLKFCSPRPSLSRRPSGRRNIYEGILKNRFKYRR